MKIDVVNQKRNNGDYPTYGDERGNQYVIRNNKDDSNDNDDDDDDYDDEYDYEDNEWLFNFPLTKQQRRGSVRKNEKPVRKGIL
jgi:hypothetical protein